MECPLKESDDGSDESTTARSKSANATGRRTKDPRQMSQRWSHVKISFDNDSVRLESEMATQQAAAGGGGSGAGERGGSALGNANTTLMTASSSLSATGGTMALSSGAAVPPTIKIIGKEVSSIRPIKPQPSHHCAHFSCHCNKTDKKKSTKR